MLGDTLHLRKGLEVHRALEEGVHSLNALELKLHMRVGVNLVVMNQPLAAVDHEMRGHLAIGAFGVKRTHLNNAVRVLKLLCKRRNIGRNHLDERKNSVEKKFICVNLIS